MILLNLTGRVCSAFSSNISSMRTVQKVKENLVRDVVTELDLRLHEISQEFIHERYPSCKLLSEESQDIEMEKVNILDGEWLVVDPLDGSNNFALGLPNYGYMAALLKNGVLTGATVVMPDHDQYILYEESKILYSQNTPNSGFATNGTVYYAYPPVQDKLAFEARIAMMKLIDSHSAGLYRYGSACAGLYNLLFGKHLAFIGHKVRIWDALAFLPLLAYHNFIVKYRIDSMSITLVASLQTEFIEEAEKIFQEKQNLNLNTFKQNECLTIEEI